MYMHHIIVLNSSIENVMSHNDVQERDMVVSAAVCAPEQEVFVAVRDVLVRIYFRYVGPMPFKKGYWSLCL